MTAVPTSSIQTLLPHAVRTTRVGLGTVQSEANRAIRVRIEGTGPASTRRLEPDTTAAAELFNSPAWPAFERGVRAVLATADAHDGDDNLRSFTLLPDEHASKAIVVLNDAAHRADRGEAFAPGVDHAGARALVREMTKFDSGNLSVTGARNLGGHIVKMPHSSRDFLATLGLYRPQWEDESQALPDDVRAAQAGRHSWHTGVHEVQHSISPRTKGDSVESTRVIEESIAEVLAPSLVSRAMRAGGADATGVMVPREEDEPAGAVNWKPWNRDHLFEDVTASNAGSAAETAATTTRRYVDGPDLVRELTRMAGIDRRTTAGRQQAVDLLQGREASHVPRRIADAIVARHGGERTDARALADLIRGAATGARPLTDVRRAVRELAG
ncbi:MAG: hypothetical protein JWO69_1358 [Thermoleophilia bacterium]|jgi:hypothetical protein|nr:hypothetical protein [Thermoleophilia bacterium]